MNNLNNENISTAMLIVTKIQERYGINSANFARIIGKNPTYVNDVKKGKTKRISDEIADKIIEQWPELSKIWLLTGKGDMLNNTHPSNNATGNNVGGDIVQIKNDEPVDKTDINRLITLLENKDKQIDRLIALLEERISKQ